MENQDKIDNENKDTLSENLSDEKLHNDDENDNKISLKSNVFFIKNALKEVHRLNNIEEKKDIKEKYFDEKTRARIDKMHQELDSLSNDEKTLDEDELASKTSADNLDKEKPLFLDKALTHVVNIKDTKKVKNFSTPFKNFKNIRILVIMLVAFVGYYAYKTYTASFDELSQLNAQVIKIQSQLPLKLDENTVLKKVGIDGETYSFTIIKDKNVFNGAKDLDKELDLYITGAKNNFCNIKLFSDIIGLGKKIKVTLDSSDNSFNREFVVEECSKEK